MITASRLTTGLAAAVLLIGLLATLALPRDAASASAGDVVPEPTAADPA